MLTENESYILPIIFYIAIIVLGIIIVSIIGVIVGSFFKRIEWKKQVIDIMEEFDLVEGGTYEILQNDGEVLKDLMFVKIYQGNRSQNGNINLLFTRLSKYRDGYITKEIVVKYGSIWKVTRVK